MEVWQEALKIALIGTERQAPAFTASEDPVGRLLAELNGEDRERTLLRAGGLLTVYRRAGYLPARAAEPLPAPAEPDEKRPAPHSVMQNLMVMVGGEYREALPEWLQTAAKRGWRLPEEHLVELLDFGRGHPEFRSQLLPLLSRRGRWLAAQNPDWKYALQFSLFEIESTAETETAEAENVAQRWQTETKEERVALLHRLRRFDPAQARTLVESTWKQDIPAERAEFLATFTAGLSMADEPFLESALDDKRKEVRSIAQDLLARLPESRLSQRMWERVRPLVQLPAASEPPPQAPGGLWNRLRAKIAPAASAPTPEEAIAVELPQICDKAMIRDGIEAKSPFSNIGEKTWWLTQMVQRVPLSYWNREWERTPAAIVAANRSEEWKQALLEAWTAALRRNGDSEWATALFAAWSEASEKMPLDSLWKETLPPDVFEAGVLTLLDQTGARIQYGHPAFTLLAEHKTVWSAALTRAVLEKLGSFTGNPYYIAGNLGSYAPSIPAEFRAEFFAVWSKLAENNAYVENQIKRHSALDTFRIEMRRKLDAAA